MIRIIGQVPPVLIGYYRPHKPKYLSKERVEQFNEFLLMFEKIKFTFTNKMNVYMIEKTMKKMILMQIKHYAATIVYIHQSLV